ncbi:hypothetical protein LWI28_001957 [Acer negundo]|uniref:Uncharacterized protein n=1 Tax=Acer negundo TaxID=4023 RepID=A0AAD5J2R7_ACENE|nr:hypothetical protein LWI28_001957 [Acer negundo]
MSFSQSKDSWLSHFGFGGRQAETQQVGLDREAGMGRRLNEDTNKNVESREIDAKSRRTHQCLSSSKLFNTTKQNPFLFTSRLHPVSQITTTESCVSKIRKAAFEDNIRREIQYELQHSPSKQISGLMQPSSTQNWLSSQGSSSGLIVKREIGVDIPIDKYPNV